MFGHTETKVIYGVPTIVKFISSNKKTTLYVRSDTNVILLKDKVYLCNAISHEELIDRYIYHKKLTVYKSIWGLCELQWNSLLLYFFNFRLDEKFY